MNQICPGSGRPTRTNGSCDCCGAPDVRGEYKAYGNRGLTDYIGELRDNKFIPPTKYVVFPSMGYWEAKEHSPMPTLADLERAMEETKHLDPPIPRHTLACLTNLESQGTDVCTCNTADAFTYLVDVVGLPKKQIISANSIDEAREKAHEKWGGRVGHLQVQTPPGRQSEPTLSRAKSHRGKLPVADALTIRYSNRGKELLSPKIFRERMTKLVDFYCVEAADQDGPGWAGKFGKVEDIALDFCEFVTALEGEAK